MKTLVLVITILLLCFTSCDRPHVDSIQLDEDGTSALTVSLEISEECECTIRFENAGKTAIRILKPLDGSYHSWLMPHYAFRISETTGESLSLRPRCGNFGYPYGGTEWPDDYLITILPGRTFAIETFLPVTIPKDGEYNIEFEYRFEPDSNMLPTNEHEYPDSLWRGRVKSNSKKAQLKKRPTEVG